MGLPQINIAFKSTASTVIKRGTRGIVTLILKDKVSKIQIERLNGVDEIPKTINENNKKQIELAFMGSVNSAKKVIVLIIPEESENYTEALTLLETTKFDYLVVPFITNEDAVKIATWIKDMRSNKDVKVKAVLPHCAADNEGVINFATDNIKVGNNLYTASEYCSRIAGMLAGCPLNISATYQPLPEVEDVPHLSKESFDEGIDSGKLLLLHDGEKVKIARAVNSLVTTNADKGEDFKKIKLVDMMDLIVSDIKKTAEDNFIGKYANNYDNKILLMSSIQSYLEALEIDNLLDLGKNKVSIDIETQKNYLKTIGIDVDNMNEQEIKEANTKDKVFLKGLIKITDAMEDINLNFVI